MRQPRSLLSNIMALGVLQISSYVIPVLIAAYSARVLGVETWGRVALVQLVLGYFSLVVSWGFSWSATRKIAAAQDDPDEVSRIAAATIASQAILAVLMIALILALVLTLPFFETNAELYLFGLGTIAGQAVFPTWLLTGLERMKEFSLIQIASRILALVLIVLLVKSPGDAEWMIGCNAAATILAGAATFVWLHRSRLFVWTFPKWRDVWGELRDGSTIFLSTSAVGMYVNLTPIILGTLAGPAATGHFVLADRLRLAAQSVLAPVSNALFPRLSRLVRTDAAHASYLLKRSALVIIGASVLIGITLFVGADHFVRIVGGPDFAASGEVLRYLALLPVIMSFSTFIGLQIILPNGRNRAFNIILVTAGMLSLLLVIPLVRWKGEIGAAITLCIVEGYVSVAMAVYLLRSGYFSGRWAVTGN
ncbi:oligosaccharide flippase family protein [Terrihabitans sp. B22-R8]|uniref:oligosaccharide flippase family protein n=1 Tax=Terrihabitans sp. B22-R8 TaxID=3425128 RepID=UPI00403CF064